MRRLTAVPWGVACPDPESLVAFRQAAVDGDVRWREDHR
jgi:hypothetical protein